MDESGSGKSRRLRRKPGKKTVALTVVVILLVAVLIIAFMFLRGAQEVDRVLTMLLNYV